MYSMARTAAFQRTVRALGLLEKHQHQGDSATSSQWTFMLLGMYLRRLNASFLLGMAVYLITARASAWYYGTAILTLCCVGSLLIATTPWLRLGLADITASLVAELERRRDWYRTVHDASRLHTVEELLLHIRSSAPRILRPSGLDR
jgi:hypothetical protein